MNKVMDKYSFYAFTREGNTIKNLIEVLHCNLTEICFIFDKNGIKLSTMDLNEKNYRIVIDLFLDRNRFEKWHCTEPIQVGITIQHLNKMIKGMKKKDSIALCISKDDPDNLIIERPDSLDPTRLMRSRVKIIKTQVLDVSIPDEYDEDSGHILIPTTGFQKAVKEMNSMSNTIKIESAPNYIRFSCSKENMYESESPFGDPPESSNELFTDEYSAKILSQFQKISGLNNKMRIYTTEGLPFKFCIDLGVQNTIGTLTVYIRSLNSYGYSE